VDTDDHEREPPLRDRELREIRDMLERERSRKRFREGLWKWTPWLAALVGLFAAAKQFVEIKFLK